MLPSVARGKLTEGKQWSAELNYPSIHRRHYRTHTAGTIHVNADQHRVLVSLGTDSWATVCQYLWMRRGIDNSFLWLWGLNHALKLPEHVPAASSPAQWDLFRDTILITMTIWSTPTYNTTAHSQRKELTLSFNHDALTELMLDNVVMAETWFPTKQTINV